MNNNGILKFGVYLNLFDSAKELSLRNRELSMPKDVYIKIRAAGVKQIVFVDENHGDKFTFVWDKFFIYARLRADDKYYFPVSIAKKIKIEAKPEWTYDNETRTAYIKETRKPEQLSLI